MIGSMLSTVSVVIGVVLLTAAARRMLLTWAAVFAYRTAPATTARPLVWVACTCRNEAERLPRLLAGLATLRYPADRLRILLIDDSSEDATPELMRRAQANDPARIRVTLLEGRQHGKADCLHAGVATADIAADDILFVMDVDHCPAPDAVEKLVNYFAAPDVAAVAIRHPVRIPSRTLVSAYCFLEAVVTEEVTSRGQTGLGLPTKLAGSWACRASVFHRLFPNGWQLVDDTVFTAAIIAGGGHIRYASDVVAVQDVPHTMHGYISQHIRWSAGYTGAAGDAIRSNAQQRTALQLIDAIATYAGYFERPLLVALSAIAIADFATSGDVVALTVVGGVAAIYSMAVTLQILVALHLSGADRRLGLMTIASLTMIAVDVVVTIRGTALGLAQRRIAWTTDHRG